MWVPKSNGGATANREVMCMCHEYESKISYVGFLVYYDILSQNNFLFKIKERILNIISNEHFNLTVVAPLCAEMNDPIT